MSSSTDDLPTNWQQYKHETTTIRSPVHEVTQDLSLPHGWRVQSVERPRRPSSLDPTRFVVTTYYYSPVRKYKLRSRAEVDLFLTELGLIQASKHPYQWKAHQSSASQQRSDVRYWRTEGDAERLAWDGIHGNFAGLSESSEGSRSKEARENIEAKKKSEAQSQKDAEKEQVEEKKPAAVTTASGASESSSSSPSLRPRPPRPPPGQTNTTSIPVNHPQAVESFDLQTKQMETIESMTQAALRLQVSRHSVREACLAGGGVVAGRYHLRFVDEDGNVAASATSTSSTTATSAPASATASATAAASSTVSTTAAAPPTDSTTAASPSTASTTAAAASAAAATTTGAALEEKNHHAPEPKPPKPREVQVYRPCCPGPPRTLLYTYDSVGDVPSNIFANYDPHTYHKSIERKCREGGGVVGEYYFQFRPEDIVQENGQRQSEDSTKGKAGSEEKHEAKKEESIEESKTVTDKTSADEARGGEEGQTSVSADIIGADGLAEGAPDDLEDNGSPSDSAEPQIYSTDKWKDVWRKLKALGWTCRPPRGLEMDWHYYRPGKQGQKGIVEGKDFFPTARAVKEYIRATYNWDNAAEGAQTGQSVGREDEPKKESQSQKAVATGGEDSDTAKNSGAATTRRSRRSRTAVDLNEMPIGASELKKRPEAIPNPELPRVKRQRTGLTPPTTPNRSNRPALNPAAAEGGPSWFPVQLHALLSDPVNADCMEWIKPDGKSFRLVDVKEFENKILRLKMGGIKFSTFKRNLNKWGFRGLDAKNAFQREEFQQNRPDLARNMFARSNLNARMDQVAMQLDNASNKRAALPTEASLPAEASTGSGVDSTEKNDCNNNADANRSEESVTELANVKEDAKRIVTTENDDSKVKDTTAIVAGLNSDSKKNESVVDESTTEKSESTGLEGLSLPVLLYTVLSDEKMHKGSIKWSIDGTKFAIVNLAAFKRNVLKAYFKNTTYNGFVRNLGRHGFSTMSNYQALSTAWPQGFYKTWAHPLFRRGDAYLLGRITDSSRLNAAKTAQKLVPHANARIVVDVLSPFDNKKKGIASSSQPKVSASADIASTVASRGKASTTATAPPASQYKLVHKDGTVKPVPAATAYMYYTNSQNVTVNTTYPGSNVTKTAATPSTYPTSQHTSAYPTSQYTSVYTPALGPSMANTAAIEQPTKQSVDPKQSADMSSDSSGKQAHEQLARPLVAVKPTAFPYQLLHFLSTPTNNHALAWNPVNCTIRILNTRDLEEKLASVWGLKKYSDFFKHLANWGFVVIQEPSTYQTRDSTYSTSEESSTAWYHPYFRVDQPEYIAYMQPSNASFQLPKVPFTYTAATSGNIATAPGDTAQDKAPIQMQGNAGAAFEFTAAEKAKKPLPLPWFCKKPSPPPPTTITATATSSTKEASVLPTKDGPATTTTTTAACGGGGSGVPAATASYSDTEKKAKKKKRHNDPFHQYFFVENVRNLLHNKEYADVLGWNSHGKTFTIKDKHAFETKLFGTSHGGLNYTAFEKELKSKGFKVVTEDDDFQIWSHPNFRRGRPFTSTHGAPSTAATAMLSTNEKVQQKSTPKGDKSAKDTVPTPSVESKSAMDPPEYPITFLQKLRAALCDESNKDFAFWDSAGEILTLRYGHERFEPDILVAIFGAVSYGLLEDELAHYGFDRVDYEPGQFSQWRCEIFQREVVEVDDDDAFYKPDSVSNVAVDTYMYSDIENASDDDDADDEEEEEKKDDLSIIDFFTERMFRKNPKSAAKPPPPGTVFPPGKLHPSKNLTKSKSSPKAKSKTASNGKMKSKDKKKKGTILPKKDEKKQDTKDKKKKGPILPKKDKKKQEKKDNKKKGGILPHSSSKQKKRPASAVASSSSVVSPKKSKSNSPNSSPTRFTASGDIAGITMRPSGKWQAQIYFAGKSRYVGVFDTREHAGVAYKVFYDYIKQFKGKVLPQEEVEKIVNQGRIDAHNSAMKQIVRMRKGQKADAEVLLHASSKRK